MIRSVDDMGISGKLGNHLPVNFALDGHSGWPGAGLAGPPSDARACQGGEHPDAVCLFAVRATQKTCIFRHFRLASCKCSDILEIVHLMVSDRSAARYMLIGRMPCLCVPGSTCGATAQQRRRMLRRHSSGRINRPEQRRRWRLYLRPIVASRKASGKEREIDSGRTRS